MKVLTLVVLSYTCISLTSPVAAIVAGSDAVQNEFPYMVSIRTSLYPFDDWVTVCAGAIISEEWILTTGTCVSGDTPSKLGAWYGNVTQPESDYLTEETKGIKGNALFVYPDFEPIIEAWNIGLLKLSKPLTFSESVQPVKLPEFGAQMPNETGTLTGWGCINSTERIWPTNLQKIDLTIFEDNFCQSTLAYPTMAYYNTSQSFCAGRSDLSIESAVISYQDDGAPFVIDGVLWGIASFDLHLVEGPYPSTFTRVSEFRQWIKEQTGI